MHGKRRDHLEPVFEEVLQAGCAAMGLDVEEAAIRQMAQYAQMVRAQNKVMNLTAITAPEEMARLHFLDSLALCSAAPLMGKRIVDVGTGAGFPGLPLKIADPSISLTLLDSQRKRVSFLENVVKALELEDVSCVHGRAEEMGKEAGVRASFDCAVSRAVADLRLLLELCLPLVKVGGVFLAMKSIHCEEEVSMARGAIEALGGKLCAPYVYTLPGTDVQRQILVIEKERSTPKQFPRRFAKMQKEPL
ncbi:MAG: 16S rRNA (guanine(527)-N(7))-methyltransferase RsmG [Oscillospiraceae bacterium]|jgi:16S rRNA (guanine527-N7)-methyltransferase